MKRELPSSAFTYLRFTLTSQILVTNQFDAELSNLFLHPRADQGVELVLKFVERRMRVKLRIARRQMRKQFQNVGFIHAIVLQQAKDALRVADSFAAKARLARATREQK